MAEWRTPHFRFVSDLDDSQAARTAESFELMYAGLVRAAGWKPAEAAPVDVVVLASSSELAAVAPAQSEGVFCHPTQWHDGLVLVSGATSIQGNETMRRA